ncbi:MAG TPA: hypothetical protein VHN99_05035 [Deinococcales bacterium]|nr:hypothetical protein [Deinococcales bacterium]
MTAQDVVAAGSFPSLAPGCQVLAAPKGGAPSCVFAASAVGLTLAGDTVLFLNPQGDADASSYRLMAWRHGQAAAEVAVDTLPGVPQVFATPGGGSACVSGFHTGLAVTVLLCADPGARPWAWADRTPGGWDAARYPAYRFGTLLEGRLRQPDGTQAQPGAAAFDLTARAFVTPPQPAAPEPAAAWPEPIFTAGNDRLYLTALAVDRAGLTERYVGLGHPDGTGQALRFGLPASEPDPTFARLDRVGAFAWAFSRADQRLLRVSLADASLDGRNYLDGLNLTGVVNAVPIGSGLLSLSLAAGGTVTFDTATGTLTDATPTEPYLILQQPL